MTPAGGVVVPMDQEDLVNGDASWRNVFGRGTDYADNASSVVPQRYRAVVGVCLRVLIGLTAVYLLCAFHCWCSGPEPKACDPQWVHFDGKCYKLLRAVSFLEADHSCRFEHGAELASVHTATENEFLSNFASVYEQHDEDLEHYGAFIGLQRPEGNSSRWQWVDGSETDYFAFDEELVTKFVRKFSRHRLCAVIFNSEWALHKLWGALPCAAPNHTAICQKLP